MDYETCIYTLFERAHHSGIKFGLSNILRLCALLNHPEKRLKIIHIAGTNGKGSVTTKIATALQEEGYKVGLYTSPHISSFRERIQINRTPISENNLVLHAEKLFLLCHKQGIDATFFELATAIAFSYFDEEKVDFVALETGLGGRFDATNICHPILSVITSLSIDHQQFLGTTIEEIAYEKAGIIKQGVPVVCGARLGQEVIAETARQQKSPLYFVDTPKGHFEEENRALAKRALEMLNLRGSSIEQGLQALPPCRFEKVPDSLLKKNFSQNLPKAILLDVAHNVDGLQKLFQRIASTWQGVPITCVFGISLDKEVNECVAVLLEHAKSVFFVQAETKRAAAASTLEKIAHDLSPSATISAFSDIDEGMGAALSYAEKNEHILVVCGTFFIMHRVRLFLGYDEKGDVLDLNERVRVQHVN